MQGMRKRRWLRIVLMICTTLLSGCGTNHVKDTDPIITINNQSVVKAEYQMVLKKHQAEIKRTYTTKEVNQKDFWTTKYNDSTPLAQLMQVVKEDLTSKKVVAELAKEAGVRQQSDYETISQQYTATSQNKTLYGLSENKLENYYDYIYSGLESEVLEMLKKKQELSEQELKAIYENEKAQYTSEIRVTMLIGEMRTDSGEDLAKQAADTMKKVSKQKQLSSKYPEINFYRLTMSTLNTEEGKSGAYTMRWNTAATMKQGEVCEPFQIGDHLFVMKCLKRQENVPEKFEDVKGVLESKIRTTRAKEKIQENIEHAEVSCSEETLKKIALETIEQE